MEWLSQNWIWVALGIGVLFMMTRGGLGQRAGGHAGHDHGRAGDMGTREDGISLAKPASDGGRPGTGAVTDSAGTATGTKTTPAQGVPQARRRHGCC